MEDKLFDLLGLGVPFYLGVATYAVFSGLDSIASDEATKVISSWLHGRSQHKPDLGNLIINAFDRVYTSPLFSLRAFRRSAAISSIIWLLLYFLPWAGREYASRHYDLVTHQLQVPLALPVIFLKFHGLILSLFGIVASDYVSLLFVRKFLIRARMYPIRASIASSMVGILVVVVSFIAFLTIDDIISLFTIPWFRQIMNWNINVVIGILYLAFSTLFLKLMSPALVIHLWLPLFALSTLIARLIFWIFRAVGWAQWFLKQGDAHPLKAIGIVATIIVFGSAMMVKEGWALLSVLERS
jgi:hypothetical protein